MVKHIEPVTIVVRDVAPAKSSLVPLDSDTNSRVVISGGKFSRYMGVDRIEAEHVTLVLTGAIPRMEVQLLKYHQPAAFLEPLRW
jgi:hypothetical protein